MAHATPELLLGNVGFCFNILKFLNESSFSRFSHEFLKLRTAVRSLFEVCLAFPNSLKKVKGGGVSPPLLWK